MNRVLAAAVAAAALTVVPLASAAVGDTRVTNDFATNTYQYSGGDAVYTDAVLQGCSSDHERQNEPAVEADPRNPSLLIASSNDYCPVLTPAATIWLGHYRSEDGGQTWVDSLVPGYPGDTSPASARAFINATSAGDPVIAWDNHGNVYQGAEASGSRDGSKKTNGDEWVARYRNPAGDAGLPSLDGSQFAYSTDVTEGSQAPNLLGKFNDKTSIEVDRTFGRCDGRVYFAYSSFDGNGNPGIWFSYSADQAFTWSNQDKISAPEKDVQGPDIAVTKDGTVYVVWRQYETRRGQQSDAIVYNVSHDCGRSFDNHPHVLATFEHFDWQDKPGQPQPSKAADEPTGDVEFEGHLDATGSARDCGDDFDSCQSGFTFFRQDSQARAVADQNDPSNTVEVIYNASKPGTEVPTGSTYGTIESGIGSQGAVYYTSIVNGAPQGDGFVVDNEARGHQFFPDVAAAGGKVHLIWWDTRNDPSYSRTLPPGNTAARTNSGDALDVYGTAASIGSRSFPPAARITVRGTNGNWEQFDDRRIPFGGDYLWLTASPNGSTYVVWTDWRDTVPGQDQRPFEADEPAAEGFDVLQCRVPPDYTDTCQAAGGKDQNIYGSALAP